MYVAYSLDIGEGLEFRVLGLGLTGDRAGGGVRRCGDAWFRVWGLGFGGWGSGGWGLGGWGWGVGCEVWELGVQGAGFVVSGLGCGVAGLWFMVYGLELGVENLCFEVGGSGVRVNVWGDWVYRCLTRGLRWGEAGSWFTV